MYNIGMEAMLTESNILIAMASSIVTLGYSLNRLKDAIRETDKSKYTMASIISIIFILIGFTVYFII